MPGIQEDGQVIDIEINGDSDSTVYGDGSDGSLTVSGNLSISSDKFYDYLYITPTGRLSTNGFRLFCRTGLFVSASGVIQANGFSGTTTSGGIAYSTTGTLGGSTAGGNAGVGAGSASVSLADSYGGSGGLGGTGSGGPGGSPGVATIPSASKGNIFCLPQALWGQVVGFGGTTTISGGCGGSAGGGAGATSGSGGGGGGGVLLVSARTIFNSGTISAIGGNGGNIVSGNGATGGGGGGGCVILSYDYLIGTGSISAVGGLAGTGSTTLGATGSAGCVIDLTQFTPKQFPGIAGWWRADLSHISLSSGLVSKWFDRTGWDHTATSSAGGTTLPTITTTLNNRPGVVFNGTNSQLDISKSVITTQDFTLGFVLKTTGSTSTGFFGQWYSNFANRFAVSASLTDITVRIGSNVASGSGFAPGLSPGILFLNRSGSDITFRKNGTTMTATLSGTLDTSAFTTIGYIGSGSIGSWCPHTIGEIVAYRRSLTTDEMKAIERNWAKRYQITII